VTAPPIEQVTDHAGSAPDVDVDPELERIVHRALPRARVLRAVALGTDEAAGASGATVKAAGYGIPIRIDVEADGALSTLVLHGTSSNRFGHDRRADRAAELILAADTFDSIPRHAPALDVGAFRRDGQSVSLRDCGEFYLLTQYVEGRPYADDLRRIAEAKLASTGDLQRIHALVDYLVGLHASRPEHAVAYERSLRDLLGAGEGIFGIVDGYGAGAPGAPLGLLQRIESLGLEWRWKLKQREPRLARIHGDFHPFNVLFDDTQGVRVLDASRGCLGDAADDVTCMAVNFVFFALEDPMAWRGAFSVLWKEFWRSYLERSGDNQLLSVAAPFLAWRLLVLACPVWYPNLSAASRERLLALAEAALKAQRFEPEMAEDVFR
jgi:hypothetical protein